MEREDDVLAAQRAWAKVLAVRDRIVIRHLQPPGKDPEHVQTVELLDEALRELLRLGAWGERQI